MRTVNEPVTIEFKVEIGQKYFDTYTETTWTVDAIGVTNVTLKRSLHKTMDAKELVRKWELKDEG